jgi:hypothetical protein
VALFIEVPVPSQENEQSCIFVPRVVDFASFYDFDILFWNCSDRVIFVCISFHYSKKNEELSQ